MNDLFAFLLAVIAVAVALGTWALWCIYAVVYKGINEHIKAMQAIYDNTKQKE